MYNPIVKLYTATQNPAQECATIASQSYKRLFQDKCGDNADALCRRLYCEGHHSCLEFAYATLHITDVSRAFMAQITRHRHFSFMCSSQHYQDYSDYPIVCKCDTFEGVPQKAIEVYKKNLENGKSPSEARMVLPECMAVNMFISGNARAWADMLRKRLCGVNTLEMGIVAGRICDVLTKWFPAVFGSVGPDCNDDYMRGCRENERCTK